MVEAAILCLATMGYQGMSFSDVIRASDAPRGSIYYHFPGGKDELVAAAMERQLDRVLDRLDSADVSSPQQVVEWFVAGWREVLVATDFAAGCALLAVSASAGSPLREQAGQLFRRWREHLAAVLTRTGVNERDARPFAAQLLAATEGAVVIARAERSYQPLDLVEQLLVEQAQQLGQVSPGDPNSQR